MLGYHDKPIVLLNGSNFYDPLLAMIDHAIEQRFAKPRVRELYHVAGTVEGAILFLAEAPHRSPEELKPSPSSAAE